ncbi:peptidoglycan editing factor PgeF [Thermomonas aquatica]|uniref:Purine nucleoside phosphorylase n=1 Tax=Thermomonas aquatica TaxID=2202149 RepID=A0A5B7ZQE8_9GAMM|nr:peptidoglycan editing factor PgeF [Thermomonas aquatica]QDA56835.1 peptidoglycan editing factor PgeF [Thermomonas aquatica]
MSAWLDADWPAPPGVRALTTTRHGLGVSGPPFDTFNLGLRSGDEADAALENRRQLRAALALPSAPRWLQQVHGIGVAVEPGNDEPEADAAVTSRAGTVLAILTADCLPVVFAAKDGSEVAAAHAGWRGLADGVLEATVAAMQAPANGIVAWFGPAAGPDAYEIGSEVFEAFVSRDAAAAAAFAPTRPGHWKVDLYALARQRLAAVGVADVHGGGLCTISDPARFFSHRRDRRSGRIATLAWIEG